MRTHSELLELYTKLSRLTLIETALRDLNAEPNETLPKLVLVLASTREPVTLDGTTHRSIGHFAHDLLRQEFVSLTISLAEDGFFPDHGGEPKKYVNVYRKGRAYGGPEEGGWWYDTLTPVTFSIAEDLTQVEALGDHYRKNFNIANPGWEKREQYVVKVEDLPPTSEPKFTPTYS